MKSIRELPWHVRFLLFFQYEGLEIEYHDDFTMQTMIHFKTYKGERYQLESKILSLKRRANG